MNCDFQDGWREGVTKRECRTECRLKDGKTRNTGQNAGRYETERNLYMLMRWPHCESDAMQCMPGNCHHSVRGAAF